MKKIKAVMQMTQTECGLCAAQMLLNYHDINIDINDISQKIETGRDGVSISKIKELLSSYNLKTSVYKAKPEEYSTITELMPFIALSKKGHYVVVERMTKKHITIVDPAVGRRNVDKAEFASNYSNVLITCEPQDDFKPIKKSKKSSILIQCVVENKKAFITMLGLTMLVYSFMYLLPLLTKKVIDTVLINLGNTKNLEFWSIVIIASFFLYWFIIYIKARVSVSMSLLLDKFLSEKVISKLFSNEFKFFLTRSSSDIQYRLGLLRGVRIVINDLIVRTIVDAGSMIVIFLYVLSIEPVFTLILLSTTLVVLLLNIILKEKIILYKNEETTADNQLQVLQYDIFRSMIDVKVLGLEGLKKNKWKEDYYNFLTNHKRFEVLMSSYRSILSALNLFIPIFTILLGAWVIYNNNSITTIGTVISLQTILGLYLSSLLSVAEFIDHSYIISSYLMRLNDILNQPDEKDGDTKVDFNGNINVKNLSFKYPGSNKDALSDISFEIKAGQKVAFTGASGSGKSTLLNVLLGVYKNFSGSLTLEGIDSNEIDYKYLRRQIGVVPQNSLLFNGSIRENISQGKELSDEDIYEALKVVSMYDFVINLPMKLNTIVSENGYNFSGGQRQRLALARALMNGDKVMFFDEATSSLDNITEANIVEYLDKLATTQILIAHRLTTIIDADVIFVLKDGKIVEKGSHRELISKKGEYYKLYYNQKGENVYEIA